MPRPKQVGLTANELEVMKILWESSPHSVADILEKLKRRPLPAYTSLLTLVQTMEKKGLITHKKEGKAYYYYPVLKEKAFFGQELKTMAQRLFDGGGGGAFSLIVNLLKNEHL